LSKLLSEIQSLIKAGQIKISEHGYDELADDNIYIDDVLNSIDDADIVEEYPNYPKGKCILLLQNDSGNKPIHTLWGVPKGNSSPAVLITSYRPDPNRWDDTFKFRKE